MAKAINDEELQLRKRARRRLVGAIALVLLVVVFLPMFLDSEPKPLNQDIAINIPPVPGPETPAPPRAGTAATVPGPSQLPATSTSSVNSQATDAVAETTPSGVQPQAGSASQPKAEVPKPASRPAKPAGKAASASAKAPSAVDSGPRAEPPSSATGADTYMVQLGAFSNAANARALQKKLQENKFKVHAESVKVGGGDRTRVRVGPYPTREAAEKARDRLKALKLVIGEAAVVRQGE
jgi:DedD protein